MGPTRCRATAALLTPPCSSAATISAASPSPLFLPPIPSQFRGAVQGRVALTIYDVYFGAGAEELVDRGIHAWMRSFSRSWYTSTLNNWAFTL